MKKFLRLFVIGLFLLSLSGMVSAEGWKKYELSTRVAYSLELPDSFVLKQLDKSDSEGNLVSVWVDQKRGIGIQVKKVDSRENFPKDQKSKYFFDSLGEEGRSKLLKGSTGGAEDGGVIQLKGNHWGLTSSRKLPDFYGKQLLVVKSGYGISLTIFNNNPFRSEDMKWVEQIYQSVEF